MSDTEKLTFKGFMKASGNTETLEKRPNVPASQAYDGWKSSKEYKKDTLIGNWIEERFKLQDLSKRRPLPSQYGHNYLTTYKQGYRSNSLPRIPEFIKYSQQGSNEPRGAFPAHQPVLDSPKMKADYSSYMTSSMEYGSTLPPLNTTSTNTAS